MDYNKKNARFLSMLGHRGAFSVALTELGNEINDMVVLTADLATLTGLERFKNAFPENIYNIGIAEQNMIGIAAGMAKDGNIVFATTYANFITMRSYEQVRINLGYMKFNIKIVGTCAGLSMGVMGNTHYAIEDVSLMRSIPGMVVISPADGIEIVKATKAAAEYDGPVYIRLSGEMNHPIVNKEDYDFQIGKMIELKPGGDIAIFATGTMVYQSLLVAQNLEKEGIHASVINVHTIKPLDVDVIKRVMEETKLIVTIEEHSIVGGLGSAIAEVNVSMPKPIPQLILGIPDRFCKVGCYEYLLMQNGLTVNQVVESVKIKYSDITNKKT